MADRLVVGQALRAHGTNGEVAVRMDSNRPERVEAGATLFAGNRLLKIVTSRRHHGKWLLRFEGISDRSGAEVLQGEILTADPIDDPHALWYHELIGVSVVETDGTMRGAVRRILNNPASDLLELDSGALVPLRFVTSATSDTIVIDVPLGLFDL